jgi:hypothetical protein
MFLILDGVRAVMIIAYSVCLRLEIPAIRIVFEDSCDYIQVYDASGCSL